MTGEAVGKGCQSRLQLPTGFSGQLCALTEQSKRDPRELAAAKTLAVFRAAH